MFHPGVVSKTGYCQGQAENQPRREVSRPARSKSRSKSSSALRFHARGELGPETPVTAHREMWLTDKLNCPGKATLAGSGLLVVDVVHCSIRQLAPTDEHLGCAIQTNLASWLHLFVY